MTECLYCAKEIQDDAMGCPWCGEWLGPPPDVDKMETERDVDGLIDVLALCTSGPPEDAAYALGRIGDERAVSQLIQCLKKDPFDLGPAASRALSDIGGPAVDPLIGLLKDEDSDVRNFAEIALEKIGGPEAAKALAAYHAR
jgi:HEAT repeat protein